MLAARLASPLALVLAGALIGPSTGPLIGMTSSAWAGGLCLEGAAAFSMNFADGAPQNSGYGTIGFDGQAGYEDRGWALGVRGFGSYSPGAQLNLNAGSYHFYGNLPRREYGLEAFGRVFFHDGADRKRWYAELGFLAVQTDFIHADSIFKLPNSPDYTRIFIRGNGFALGAGYRPVHGDWFFQVNYMLKYYENVQLVGQRKHLHYLESEPKLDSSFFIHAIYFSFGLEVFGRSEPGVVR
jgi:hypothetical protein